MAEPIIEVDGKRYRVVAAPANEHGASMQAHFHDEPHADGTPGQPRHHHCDVDCQERSARLVPVDPDPVPERTVYSNRRVGGGIEWHDEPPER